MNSLPGYDEQTISHWNNEYSDLIVKAKGMKVTTRKGAKCWLFFIQLHCTIVSFLIRELNIKSFCLLHSTN